MKHRKAFWPNPILIFAALSLAAACLSEDSDAEKPAPVYVQEPCKDEYCKPGNVCAGEPAECHLKCLKHTDCPHGYGCGELPLPDDGGMVSVCVPIENATTEGGYGTKCGDDYAKCQDGFVCPGNLGDTETTCTKLDGCETDDDCPPAYWCGAIRDRACIGDRACESDDDCKIEGAKCVALDADGQVKRCKVDTFCHTSPDDCPVLARPKDAPSTHTYKTTCSTLPDPAGDKLVVQRKACLPRTYCSPCETDADCTEPTSACIEDKNGEKFCSVQCTPNGFTCDPGSACEEVGNDFYCVPKSGSCKGDGASCASCRTDEDCGPGGYCYTNPVSRERFCMQPCAADKSCPNTPAGMTQRCCTDPDSCGALLNYCMPEYYVSVSDSRYAMGCWISPCESNADCEGSQQPMRCEVTCRAVDAQAAGLTCPNPVPKACVPRR